MLDPERGGVEDGGQKRAVGRREAVEASLLEPLDLLRQEIGAAGSLVDGQLPVQPRAGER